MARIHHLISSFNSGELTPEMDRRLGVEKVAAGCRILENFIPRVHGPAFKRPGLVYLGEAYSSVSDEKSRLIPFNYSTTTSFILELYAEGARVWSNGLLVPLDQPIVLPYRQSELFEVQFRQVNDVVYLVHPNHPPHKIIRKTNTLWESDPLFDLGVNSPSGGVTTGETGKAILEEWAPWAGTYPTTVTAARSLPAQSAFQAVPSSSTDVTSVEFPAGSGVFMRRIRSKLIVPTTGVYTVYTGPNDDGGMVMFINETYIISNPNGQAAEFTQLVQLTGGKEYRLEVYSWNTSGAYDTTVKLSGPGVAKDFIGASLIAKPDTSASVSVREEIRQYPPMLSENVTDITITPSGTSGSITLTASEALFQQGHEGAYFEIAHKRDSALVEIVGVVGAFSGSTSGLRVVGTWDFYTYGTWSGTVHLERQNTLGGWDIVRTWKGNKDRNVITSGTEEQESTLRIRAVGCDGEAASGADVPRFLLEAADAEIVGLVRVTDVTSPTVATADVITSLHAATATLAWTEGAFSAHRGFPRAIAMHQQRLVFAGTKDYPVGIWGSVANDLENFRRTTLEDGSFFFQLAAEEANAIQWMVSFSRLLIGTNGELWSADGGGEGAPLNSTSVRFVQGGRFGSAYLPATLVHEVPVFVERTGRKVRRVTYSQEEEKFIGSNLTVLSEHVTEGGIVQMAFSQQPNAILWGVTGAGILIGMTFENEQNVYGWHRHVTDGTIESVAVVYGASADEVWVTVLRTINGAEVRTVERLDPTASAMDFSDPTTLVYSDCAITIDPAGSATISVPHLAGATVNILADGAELPQAVVSEAGELTLDADDYSTVIVGLPFTARLQPWRQEFQMEKGTAQGNRVKVANSVLMLLNSMGGEVADSPTGRRQAIKYREASDPMDTRLPLFTGERQVKMASDHRESVDTTIFSGEPFPFNVTAITLKLDVYDTA